MTVRVLIVDDDPALRRALGRVLRAHEVALVEAPAEALRLLGESRFDVILTDYGISPTDGVALLHDVAAAHPSVRRYLMSGFDSARFEPYVATKLIARVFPKPLDLDALRVELASIVTAS